MKALLLTLSFLPVLASAGVHSYYECRSTDGFILFTYDQKGQTVGNTKPGFCKLAQTYRGKPFSHYWCWVEDTQTAATVNGQLAIQFEEYLGDGVHLFTQLNVPQNILKLDSFQGTSRLLSRSAKDLTKPMTKAQARAIDCKKMSFNFPEY